MQLLRYASAVLPTAKQTLMAQNHRLDHLEQNARANDPQRILARGYALVRKNGVLVTSAGQLCEGDPIHIQTAEGSAGAQITSIP